MMRGVPDVGGSAYQKKLYSEKTTSRDLASYTTLDPSNLSCKFPQSNRRISAMKVGRIGVWFSLALAIFLLSGWLGSTLGARLAVYRYRSAQSRRLGTLNAPEHAHLELVLDELQSIGFLRLTYLITLTDNQPLVPRPEQLGKIDAFRRKVATAEAKPVMEMNLALADVVAAITEERQGNIDRAADDIRSAQALYRSLGWRDYSEESLKALAQRELDEWTPHWQRSQTAK